MQLDQTQGDHKTQGEIGYAGWPILSLFARFDFLSPLLPASGTEKWVRESKSLLKVYYVLGTAHIRTHLVLLIISRGRQMRKPSQED